MNHKLTSRDVPKILLVLALFLALGGGGWIYRQQAAAQQEQARAILQARRESGQVVTPEEEGLSPAEADAEKNRRDDADPNFQS